MKNLMFTAAALTILACSTLSMGAATSSQTSAKAASKLTVKTNVIPPGCPPGDPNGCGIFE